MQLYKVKVKVFLAKALATVVRMVEVISDSSNLSASLLFKSNTLIRMLLKSKPASTKNHGVTDKHIATITCTSIV